MSKKFLKNRMRTALLLNLIMGLVLFMVACGDNATTTAPSTTLTTTTISTTATSASTSVAPTSASATTPAITYQPTDTPDANPYGLAPDEVEVTFPADKDQLYGTLRVPKGGNTAKKPAALIIVGSGQTDRNGNIPDNIYKNFATVLAGQDIISLRYDKLTTGKTGFGSYASHPSDIDFNLFIDEAHAAYNYLKARPEVDPSRIMIIGHSEGGLIALALTDRLKSSGEPKALVLASTIPLPILDFYRPMVVSQYADIVSAGTYTQADADAVLVEYDTVAKALLTTGKLPNIKNLSLYQYFPLDREKYIAQETKYDPEKIAAQLPTDLPVLLFCGQKDQTVNCKDVKTLAQSFEKAGNTNAAFNQITNMDHLFKDIWAIPHGMTDWLNPAIKFSPAANKILAEFAKTKL